MLSNWEIREGSWKILQKLAAQSEQHELNWLDFLTIAADAS